MVKAKGTSIQTVFWGAGEGGNSLKKCSSAIRVKTISILSKVS